MKVLNFGSMNLDYAYQVERFVQAGETMNAMSQTVKAGGKGLNQSVALSRAGAEVWHAGCIGRGGETLREVLRQNHVHDDYLTEVDAIQGNAVIQVNQAGENCILLYGGSNRCITLPQIEKTIRQFSPGDWLILQNEINLLSKIVDQGFQRGMKVVLNPSPFDSGLKDVDFHEVSWLLLNEIEAEQFTGCKEPERAWESIHAQYPGVSVLITSGRVGSIAWQVTEEKTRTAVQPAFSVKAVDTTAAGDTYTGYFICGLMEGRSLTESMRRASLAAAIAVTRTGAAESVPALVEVELDGRLNGS